MPQEYLGPKYHARVLGFPAQGNNMRHLRWKEEPGNRHGDGGAGGRWIEGERGFGRPSGFLRSTEGSNKKHFAVIIFTYSDTGLVLGFLQIHSLNCKAEAIIIPFHRG